MIKSKVLKYVKDCMRDSGKGASISYRDLLAYDVTREDVQRIAPSLTQLVLELSGTENSIDIQGYLSSKTVIGVDEQPDKYTVYRILLDPSAAEDIAVFRRQKKAHSRSTCFYIGNTAKPLRYRLGQHLGTTPSSKGKDIGCKKIREHITKKSPIIGMLTGIRTLAEANKEEARIGQAMRNADYLVHWA